VAGRGGGGGVPAGRGAGDRGAAGPGAVDGEPGGAQELPVPGGVPGGVAAQRRAEDRARRPKAAKLAGNDELRGWAQGRLRERWSPEQVSQRLAAEFPDRPEMRVSHETIYQSLYVQGRGALRRELARTPTGCCASTSPRAPRWPGTARASWPRSLMS